MARWIEHPNFDGFLNENWVFTGNMYKSLVKLIHNLKEWNKLFYGHITTRKQTLVKTISNIQSKVKF